MTNPEEGAAAAAAEATLKSAVEEQSDRLMNCVHCGFCLPACPTYTRLGDENDSPRGRLYLMRAVTEGRLDPGADAFQTHIDRCLGCRACEPVCPSGVEYGYLLERAREAALEARSPGLLTRLLLAVFGRRRLMAPAMVAGRMLRALGIPALLARLLPGRGLLGKARTGLAMLAASAPAGPFRDSGEVESVGERGDHGPAPEAAADDEIRTVALLRGCVQQGLYGRVNRATARVLRANGYRVVEVEDQGCCGALHAHAGDLEGARELARANIRCFEEAGVDALAVNAAGCGAAMREYHELLARDPEWAGRADGVARATRDVSELLARRGPRSGARVSLKVAYDAPCHLVHAQRVAEPPLRVLDAIPGLERVPLENAEECCGGAGIYGLTHPELGGRIGGDKVERIRASGAEAVATGNPGCMMQIGAGLRLAGSPIRVFHPVELLDESYRRAGLYRKDEHALSSSSRSDK